MAMSDPMEILLAHNAWANRQIVGACGGLSEEAFHRTFEMGLGSLHDTMTHVAGAMRGWGDLLAGREFRPRPEAGEKRSPDEVLAMLEEAAGDVTASARAHPMDEVVTRERGGKTYSFTRGGVVTHVTTHGMHHRAQCLNMLRQLGVDPLPPVAIVEWMLMADSPA